MSDIAKWLKRIAICVLINLVGALITHVIARKTNAEENLLFLDLVGTALASLIYGPITGALVGLLTNGLLGLLYENYFLFGIVQVVSAAAWGALPRLLEGRAWMDFFNDDMGAGPTRQNAYRYVHLVVGLVLLSFISNLLASLTVAIIMNVDSSLTCVALEKAALANTPESVNKIVCDVAKKIFVETGAPSGCMIAKLTVAKAFLGWPDHLISLSFGVLMVAYFFPDQRHNMTGPFGHTREAKWNLFIVIAIVFVILFLTQLNAMAEGKAFPWIIYTVVMFAILLLANIFRTRAWDRPLQVYSRINPDLEHAFEDTLRLGVIAAVVTYIVLGKDLFGPEGRDKFTGALGVVFLLIFFRYFSLFVVRAFGQAR